MSGFDEKRREVIELYKQRSEAQPEDLQAINQQFIQALQQLVEMEDVRSIDSDQEVFQAGEVGNTAVLMSALSVFVEYCVSNPSPDDNPEPHPSEAVTPKISDEDKPEDVEEEDENNRPRIM